MDDNGTDDRPREYRVEELAEAAGIPVRTLRFYRERRLLPPPRRAGRIAWYSEDHLARLRTIAALLDRGHTLGGIAELIAAWETGRTLGGVAELLGLESALAAPWSDETPVRLTPQELAHYFGEHVTPDNLSAALEIGYIAVDGENAVHISRRLLEASSALVREGVPLAAVLAAGREVREHVDALAELFTQVIKVHVLGPLEGPPPREAHRMPEALQRLRPLAKNIVEAEMSLAMDRRVRAEIDALLRQRAGTPAADSAPDLKQDRRDKPDEGPPGDSGGLRR
ncbi:MerR HTH family regulatory protein [Streptomyces sp. DvalAA-14]|uniref:MerR family transcriptional regulator n=1 Tax=unclassified Streptomyces TaxID=2593676 RepID=UPI00081B1DE6|nr:MerR family transcriptional regulator [Streptomyces sp. DvalAA-14]MYS23933.1 MerR family transcriptional regulator [Streptomyces sp. SID4948]SCE40665.1 MerR HTH family regulatory protein [Streptomyces sp. DvalAA-14]